MCFFLGGGGGGAQQSTEKLKTSLYRAGGTGRVGRVMTRPKISPTKVFLSCYSTLAHQDVS